MRTFCSYVSRHSGKPTVGLVSPNGRTVTRVLGPEDQPFDSLMSLVEAWPEIQARLHVADIPEDIAAVEVLAPLPERDVLTAGKGYTERSREFQRSGSAGSEKREQSLHSVTFPRRATPATPPGYLTNSHAHFTNALEYEGELGIIIGKQGFGVAKEDAMDYVWGYTIINDSGAQERQRDHKPPSLSKLLDTACSLGPLSVPATDPNGTRLALEVRVNGELRQQSSANALIFDIPTLIEAVSSGLTIRPGDVIATRTPHGLGTDKTPPHLLKPGDTVEVSVAGLGKLVHRIGAGGDPAGGRSPSPGPN